MKTKLLFAPLFLLAACGTEGSYGYDSESPPNLGTPCDEIQENGNYVFFCGGVQLNVDDPGHAVKCYLKVEEDGTKTVRCNTGTKLTLSGGDGC